MKKILAGALFLAISSTLFSQEIVVAYADGLLEVKEGTRWSELFIGDFVEPTDEVRLAAQSYAELASAETTVKLSRPGTYRVDELIVLTNRNTAAGIGSFLMNQFNRLSAPNRPAEQTSAGGARASEAQAGAGPWQGGSTSTLIQDGLETVEAGDLEAAYYIFEEAYDFAITDEQYQDALFYYGYASALIGRTAQAIGLLSEIGPDPDRDYYVSHAVVLGQLFLDSVAYRDALVFLDTIVDDDRLSPQERQSVQLMMGLAYVGLGEAAAARATLVQARDLIPGSDASAAARRLLSDL